MPIRKLSIVIDADIARASGLSEHPVSKNSRKLLEHIMKCGHSIPMCPTLRREWNKHRSNYAKRWLASMIAKKRVKFVEDKNSCIKNYISQNMEEGKLKQITIKDAHLVDLALIEDKLVISNDDIARAAFCEISKNCLEITPIIWLNAVSNREFILQYLSRNCYVPENLYLKPSK